MTSFRLFTVAVLCVAFISHALADGGDDWVISHTSIDEYDASVYVKPLKGQTLKAFKGIIAMPYTTHQIVTAIKDRKRMPEWVYQCSKVKENIIKRDRSIYYTQIKGIWPVKSRDVVLKSTFKKLKDNSYRGIDQSISGIMKPKSGFVRLPHLKNKWYIYPAVTQKGWSIIEFETEADVGGGVPTWLANMAAIDAPRKTLSGLRALLDTGDYGKPSVISTPRANDD